LFTAQFRKAGVCILTYNLSYYTPYVRVRLWWGRLGIKPNNGEGLYPTLVSR
jgi:hypothetical protein